MVRLRKGEVRNLLGPPKTVKIDGKTVKVAPSEVSVFKDRWGRYTVRERGVRMTASERRLGLRPARGKEAKWIRSEYEMYGSDLKMRKIGGKENRSLRAWEVGSLRGWVDLKKGEFISRDYPTHLGDMERLMRSLSATTWALINNVDFGELWSRLTGDEKFVAMTKLSGIDWDNFFKSFIDSDGSRQDVVSEELQGDGLVRILKILVGRGGNALEL